MRNHSRKYRRARRLRPGEWEKIVRFNGRGYLMRSVFDKDAETSSDEIGDDIIWNTEHSLENTVPSGNIEFSADSLPWMHPSTSAHSKINEDFFDDFGTDILVNQPTAQETVIKNSGYPLLTASGDTFDVTFSSDEIKNAIFHLIADIITLYDSKSFSSIDDFLYESGRMNDISSYKMAFADMVYRNGTFSVVPLPARLGAKGGHLQIYFTGEREARFRFDWPDISFHRPTSQINIGYERLCSLIDMKPGNVVRKNASEYYGETLKMLYDEYMKENINLTLVRRKDVVPGNVFGHCDEPKGDSALIKRCFTPVAKFSATTGDFSVLEDEMQECMRRVTSIYKGENADSRKDDTYILIGGRETYLESLYQSSWMRELEECNIFSGDYVAVRFYTPDPKTPVMKIEHNMLLVPMSRFVTAAPGLLMHILS